MVPCSKSIWSQRSVSIWSHNLNQYGHMIRINMVTCRSIGHAILINTVTLSESIWSQRSVSIWSHDQNQYGHTTRINMITLFLYLKWILTNDFWRCLKLSIVRKYTSMTLYPRAVVLCTPERWFFVPQNKGSLYPRAVVLSQSGLQFISLIVMKNLKEMTN
jgi:hypothetical protein